LKTWKAICNSNIEIISVTLTVDGNRFEGTVGGDGGEIPITGEKVE